MWGPPFISWFISPTIVISTINHSYWSYVHQLNAIDWRPHNQTELDNPISPMNSPLFQNFLASLREVFPRKSGHIWRHKSIAMTDPAGAGILMLTWLGYIDGIHGTPYIAAPWILWDIKKQQTSTNITFGGTFYLGYLEGAPTPIPSLTSPIYSPEVATLRREVVFFCISKYTTINIPRVSHELSDLSPWNISWNIPLILVFQYIVLYHHLREKSW